MTNKNLKVVSTFIFSFVRQHGSVNAVTNCIYTKTDSTWWANVVPKKHGILPQSKSCLLGLFTETNWVANYLAHSGILPGYIGLESLVYDNSTSRIEWNTYFLQEHNQSISMSGENYWFQYPYFQQRTSHSIFLRTNESKFIVQSLKQSVCKHHWHNHSINQSIIQ